MASGEPFNGVFDNEVGWPELVETVAKIRDSLPVPQRATLGVLAANDGEAGAVNLYGRLMAYQRPLAG